MTEHLLSRSDLQDSRRLKHEQLRSHLVQELVAGRLKAGEALPSESQFAEAFGMTRKTIRRAMASLESDGLIRRVQGKGNFVEKDAWRKLRSKLDVFALVVPATQGGFFPSLLHGFERTAIGFSHQTLVCNHNDNITQQAEIVLQLIDKRIGGVAIMPASLPPTPAYQIRQLQEHGIPVVFCHRRVEGVAAPLLATPYEGVGQLAGNVLLDHGHCNVAFMATERTPVTAAYQKGLGNALRAGGCEAAPQAICVGERIGLTEQEAVLEVLREIFAKPDRPTAIFASFDTLAETIYLQLPQIGLRVPQDVSLLGFGGAWRERTIEKRLTSVVLDEITTGKEAASLLQEMCNGERPIDDSSEIVLDLKLSVGETLARVAGK